MSARTDHQLRQIHTGLPHEHPLSPAHILTDCSACRLPGVPDSSSGVPFVLPGKASLSESL